MSEHSAVVIPNLSSLFPEIEQYDLPLHTLSDLGYRRSAQAQKAGYICVRSAYSTGYRTIPGLWLHPDDLPTYQAAAQQIMGSESRNRASSKPRNFGAAKNTGCIAAGSCKSSWRKSD